MFEPKQILVPTDFSPSAWAALEDGAAIAKVFGASLDVIHVWDIPTFSIPGDMTGYGLPNTVIDAVSAQAHVLMAEFLGQARAKGFTIRKAEVVPGSPSRGIIELAQLGGYDLIVIGSHGRRGLSRVMLGSVAERVVRHAPCRVLVVSAKVPAGTRSEDAAVPSAS